MQPRAHFAHAAVTGNNDDCGTIVTASEPCTICPPEVWPVSTASVDPGVRVVWSVTTWQSRSGNPSPFTSCVLHW